MDYEKDIFDGESETGLPSFASAPPPGPSIARQVAAAHRESEDALAPDRKNEWREKARRELASKYWIDITGRKRPLVWTVGCAAYYEILCHCGGLSRPQGGPLIIGSKLTSFIFLWLATHDQAQWFQRDPEYGRALKDDPDLWLEIILMWADDEFPLGPDQFSREIEAATLHNEVLMLSFAPRAEPMPEAEPDDGAEPGNSHAPHGAPGS